MPVAVRRYRSARRLKLRVDSAAGLLRLSLPTRTSKAAALRWAGEQGAWVAAQLSAVPALIPFADGAHIPFEGELLQLQWREGQRRGVERRGDRLLVGGPVESLARQVQRWLVLQARNRLSDLTSQLAAEAGVTVCSVGVGDAVSRWGSCSSSGAIRYNWRLILAPPQVLRFVVAHEVAHRLHMDHSPAFKRVEERLFGGPVAPARALLRELGPGLRRVGRGS